MRLAPKQQTNAAPYVVTRDDALWLARAVEHEGPSRMEVAATLINGFLWARARRRYSHTLTDWIRSYAQPVNPRWFEDGDLFQRAYATAAETERPGMLAKARQRRVFSEQTDFSAPTRVAVHAALNGAVPLPADATDYAAPNHVHAGYHLLTSPGAANWLWRRPGAEGWQGYRVVDGDTSSVLPWLVVACLIGVLIWKAG